MPKHTTKSFIEKAQDIHKEVYDYSQVEYKKAHTNVTIICKKHGPFQQRPDAHIHQKQGCPICGLANRRTPNKKTTEQFILEAKNKWGDKYDYTNTVYVNKQTKLKYVCSKHGEIEQKPFLHIKSGCQFCNGRGISRHSKTSFVNIANEIHKNRYDYSKTKFLRMTDDINITCHKHGEFIQRAGNHIHLKNGCPHCARLLTTSKAEKEIAAFVKENYSGTVLENDRDALDGKEIDVYIPDLKLGIEYHGIYWHLETVVGRKYHYNKWKRANDRGIRLIQIYSNEWADKRVIWESKILNFLGYSTKIGARKTIVCKLNRHDKEEFLTKNHLQGSDSSKIALGLRYKDELVSCMTFGPSRFNKKYDWELLRFCNKRGISVIGGASRLLKYFDKEGSIISYADKRYSDGGLYRAIGFKLDGETQPSFMYYHINKNKLYNRMKFQKASLKTTDSSLTEYEIMQKDGFDRIWDAGLMRFVKN